MKLTVENDQWKLGDKIIDSTDVPLDCIVLAAEKLYPWLQVELDTDLSPNPWFGKRLVTYAIDAMSKEFKSVDLEALAAEFAATNVKICTRCGENTYYNAAVNNWQCPDCLGIYTASQRPLQFITRRNLNPRRYEAERRREYFGKRTMRKP
jgi:hypothetical protein